MVTLEQEVVAKRAQLEALQLEHMALAAKARALDQLVVSRSVWRACVCHKVSVGLCGEGGQGTAIWVWVPVRGCAWVCCQSALVNDFAQVHSRIFMVMVGHSLGYCRVLQG